MADTILEMAEAIHKMLRVPREMRMQKAVADYITESYGVLPYLTKGVAQCDSIMGIPIIIDSTVPEGEIRMIDSTGEVYLRAIVVLKKKCPYGDPYCPCQDGDPCNHEES